MYVLAVIPALLGILVGWGGVLGLRGRLPRDRGAGVRTRATLRSDEAFRVANRVAGLPTLVAGLVGLASGAAALVMPATAGPIIAAVLGLVAMFVLVAGGGMLGHRAALAVPPPEVTAPAGSAGQAASGSASAGSALCTGCACGSICAGQTS